MNYKMATTTAAFTLIVLSMIVGGMLLAETAADRFINLGFIGIAIALGAILGTALAPFDRDEKRRFDGYGKAFSIFLTGYLASKADQLVSKAFDPNVYAQLTSLGLFRLVAVVAVGLSVAKLTFAFRSYGSAAIR